VGSPHNEWQFKVITPEIEVAAVRKDRRSLHKFLFAAVTVGARLNSGR